MRLLVIDSSYLQSLVYHFVASFILFLKQQGRLSRFCLWKALRRLEAGPAKCLTCKTLAAKGLMILYFLYTFYFYKEHLSKELEAGIKYKKL